MSELERDELITRIKAMNDDEMKLVAKLIPNNILWDEMKRRDDVKTHMLTRITDTLTGGI